MVLWTHAPESVSEKRHLERFSRFAGLIRETITQTETGGGHGITAMRPLAILFWTLLAVVAVVSRHKIIFEER